MVYGLVNTMVYVWIKKAIKHWQRSTFENRYQKNQWNLKFQSSVGAPPSRVYFYNCFVFKKQLSRKTCFFDFLTEPSDKHNFGQHHSILIYVCHILNRVWKTKVILYLFYINKTKIVWNFSKLFSVFFRVLCSNDPCKSF